MKSRLPDSEPERRDILYRYRILETRRAEPPSASSRLLANTADDHH
jgi:hypothetical protein